MGLDPDEPDEAAANGRANMAARRRGRARQPGAFLLQTFPERPIFQSREAEHDESGFADD